MNCLNRKTDPVPTPAQCREKARSAMAQADKTADLRDQERLLREAAEWLKLAMARG